MARRRNAVTHRFARIKGLPPEEKALMQRIGNLMDAALNNRQASNPFEQSQQRSNRQIYPPTGLLTQTGVSSVKILWNATPSNELLRYEVDFTNLTTGLNETKTTFTNEIIYKGANGSYVARIKSVGRDGSSSTIRQVTFAMGDDIMLLEGAKNGATELGTLVQDNIELRDGYSIYVWGSCVLDKYVLQTNNDVVLRLWRADTPDASFAEAYLVETIVLYPATESGTDLDDTARGGVITRPVGVRTGSFETSQAVMFSPMQVDPDDDEKTVTFFLQAINRETEQDEVCLSLVMWSGADGIGTAVPSDPFQPRAPAIFPHFNSFHKQGAPNGAWQGNFPYDTRSWHATVEEGFSLVGNKWTVAMWVRFDTLDGFNMARGMDEDSPDGGDQQIFNKGTMDDNSNAFEIWMRTADNNNCPAAGNGYKGQHELLVTVKDYRAGTAAVSEIIPDQNPERTFFTTGCTSGDRSEKSGIYPWGDAQSTRNDTENNAWYFIVVCFEGGNFVNANVPKVRVYINSATDPLFLEPRMAKVISSSDTTINGVTQTDVGYIQYLFEALGDTANHHYLNGVYNGDLYSGPVVTAGTQYYQIGIWNTSLDSGVSGPGSDMSVIETLFNLGRGYDIDWRRNVWLENPSGEFGAVPLYGAAYNLVHLSQQGAVEQPFATKQAGRDTGYYLPDWEGSMNWTFDAIDKDHEFHQNFHGNPDAPFTVPPDRYHQRKIQGAWYDNLGQSWTRGCDIYDVLSPLGTNNTTAYDFSYPGQNMSSAIGNSYWQDGDDTYPDYDEWFANGADLTILPWISGPYPPGYHKDDPNRPIKGQD